MPNDIDFMTLGMLMTMWFHSDDLLDAEAFRLLEDHVPPDNLSPKRLAYNKGWREMLDQIFPDTPA